jgi:hypothetical protein
MEFIYAKKVIKRIPGCQSVSWLTSAGKISSWPFFLASSFSRLFASTSPRTWPPSLPSEQLAKPQTSSSPSWPSLPPRSRFFGFVSGFLLRRLLRQRLSLAHIQEIVGDSRSCGGRVRRCNGRRIRWRHAPLAQEEPKSECRVVLPSLSGPQAPSLFYLAVFVR